ncbi:hypothetical protein E8E12_003179 [Didymella heteroderae]|uniref:Uncharacterized protein n=1 Tax=Didymella heteroderae TaxID=1769908 RepID=A0A9P4WJK8_9PLEO|nr:hypothetical protein E8E12_003179 [Didymella heteroderae]
MAASHPGNHQTTLPSHYGHGAAIAADINADSNAELGPVDLIMTGSRQLVTGFLTLLIELIKAIIRFITPLAHLMPSLAMYMRVMQAIPTTISFMLSDNIHFVDALGTKHSLPFQNPGSSEYGRLLLKSLS